MQLIEKEGRGGPVWWYPVAARTATLLVLQPGRPCVDMAKTQDDSLFSNANHTIYMEMKQIMLIIARKWWHHLPDHPCWLCAFWNWYSWIDYQICMNYWYKVWMICGIKVAELVPVMSKWYLSCLRVGKNNLRTYWIQGHDWYIQVCSCQPGAGWCRLAFTEQKPEWIINGFFLLVKSFNELKDFIYQVSQWFTAFVLFFNWNNLIVLIWLWFWI